MNKTIAAISTAMGVSGIAVIRISGENAQIIADKVCKGNKKISEMNGYTAQLAKVYDKNNLELDECIVLNFVAPKSFTGENLVELSCHGGTFIAKKVLQAVIDAGASNADTGEFTKRAFLNGKMDLTQAESVIELIHANGEKTHEASMSVKNAVLSKNIKKMSDALVEIGADLSAWADYPDDDIPQVDEKMLKTKLKETEDFLSDLINKFDMGKVYREGVKTVIAGRPNAGKSTLMNMLSGCERSIVTHIAGTTRDIVEETVMLGSIPLVLADTAGIRDTDDIVEQIGVKMALDKINSSELVLAVFDASLQLSTNEKEFVESLEGKNVIAIINKTDLDINLDIDYIKSKFKYSVSISAKNGEGLDELVNNIEYMFGSENIITGSIQLCTNRQRESVNSALKSVREAISLLDMGMTLDAVTVTVEEAVSYLLELTGEKVSETVINNVFERFCVGK